MPTRLRDVLGGLGAMALGVAAFLVLVGWTTLIPTNIGWLNFADRAMHTLGWMFFRETDWHMPPGASPDLGIELSASIGLVDGLPLFALPLKLVAVWLPQPFQYWGYWLLLSFTLQSWFAYRIARELGAGHILALAAAAFALITPAFMFRVPMHLALSGHWTVLAALFLSVRQRPPVRWMWPALVILTASIHAYLLAIVLALFAAGLVERLWTRRADLPAAVLEFALSLGGAILVMWTAGFFVVRTVGTYGYGDYKLNLLWPIIRYRWSQIFPDIPHTKFDYEGLSFLGIGILALLVIGLVTGAMGKLRAMLAPRWLPLAVVLLLLMVFAFSKDIAFANIPVLKFSLPKPIEDAASAFRSTGRFVWPLLYLVTIGAVVLTGRRLPPLVSLPLVLVALVAQVVDSTPALLSFSQRIGPPSSTWTTPLLSPFWERAAKAGYTRIRVIPATDPGKDWQALGYFAVTHGMDIDSAYLGRMDTDALARLRQHDADMVATGMFEPHTIYELDVQSALTVSANDDPDDLLAIIDNRIIFAKNGLHLVDGLGVVDDLMLGVSR